VFREIALLTIGTLLAILFLAPYLDPGLFA
jgi:hypothetical protein